MQFVLWDLISPGEEPSSIQLLVTAKKHTTSDNFQVHATCSVFPKVNSFMPARRQGSS